VNHTAGFEEQDVVLLADNRKRITVAACKLWEIVRIQIKGSEFYSKLNKKMPEIFG
jgi:hypothetical protein